MISSLIPLISDAQTFSKPAGDNISVESCPYFKKQGNADIRSSLIYSPTLIWFDDREAETAAHASAKIHRKIC